jgi:hypothetical protein
MSKLRMAAAADSRPRYVSNHSVSGYCVNIVQLHVNAADVLVRSGIDGDGFR